MSSSDSPPIEAIEWLRRNGHAEGEDLYALWSEWKEGPYYRSNVKDIARAFANYVVDQRSFKKSGLRSGYKVLNGPKIEKGTKVPQLYLVPPLMREKSKYDPFAPKPVHFTTLVISDAAKARARNAAKGFDIKELERAWREYVHLNGVELYDATNEDLFAYTPDDSFVRFCKDFAAKEKIAGAY